MRREWFGTVSRPSRLAFGVGLLSVVSIAVTYALLSGLTPYVPTSGGLQAMLLVNTVLVVALAGLIAWRVTLLWAERKSGRAGARLHWRLVTWFSLIAVLPAILVAIFAMVTLNLGLDQMFSGRVKTALGSAESVAREYSLSEARSLGGDGLQMLAALEQDPRTFDKNKQVQLSFMFSRLAELTHDRSLLATFVVDSKGKLLGSVAPTHYPYSADLRPSAADFAYARNTTAPVIGAGDPATGIIHALVYIPFLNDANLLVVRKVDPQVFSYYQRTRAAVSEYNRLNQNRLEVQLVFAALYVVVSLVVLLASIWAGLWAANRLVQPISSLITAAERVSEGDLTAQVAIGRDDDEIGSLGRAFNRMTQQLGAQRGDLVDANRLIDERRRFTETVLSGVSAGVIGLDHDGTITIVNRAAARLLNGTPEDISGRHYSESVPELAALIRRAISDPVGRASGEVAIKRTGSPRTLSVQITSERGSHARGFVITFDDITDLVSAQRTAAWADVARRIAHEIKNPLTPIQLAAERLKRKYMGEVTTDPDIFRQCIDTIVRQVGDIGRMVDEFSSFARMPAPVMRRENAAELMQQAVFLQRVAHPEITFTTNAPKETVTFEGDGRLIAQALTNVLKNAGEGIAARHDRGDEAPGKIHIALEPRDGMLAFRITDNGIGLPPEHRHRLTEPYVTTRAKGTGLGLAIVRKIMEDHGGEIMLGDSSGGEGAEVTLTFPFLQKSLRQKGNEDEQKRIADRV